MSATNYTPIYLYNSGTATNTPSAANLGAGELAINYADGKLFYKDGSAAVQVIAWKTTPTTAGGTGLTSYTAGDLPYYASGSALSKLAIGTANYVLTSSGTAPQYVAQSTLSVGTATNATNTAITDNTSSSATWYPTIVSATTGNLPQTTSSTKLSFVPSTGILTSTGFSGAHNGTVGATTPSTGAFTTLSASTSFQNSTWITSGRPTGVTGLQGYNTTLKGVEVYNGSAWDSLTGPVFSAYPSANQTVTSATFTNVTSDTKNFDTNGCFNNTGSSTTLNGLTAPAYAFVPNVPGYYQVTALLATQGNITGSTLVTLYKNGTRYQDGQFANANPFSYFYLNYLMYFNGTGDYIQLYGYVSSSTPGWYGGANASYFQATFVRGA